MAPRTVSSRIIVYILIPRTYLSQPRFSNSAKSRFFPDYRHVYNFAYVYLSTANKTILEINREWVERSDGWSYSPLTSTSRWVWYINGQNHALVGIATFIQSMSALCVREARVTPSYLNRKAFNPCNHFD